MPSFLQQKILIEACVASVESALAAQEGGAKRIELCDNLVEGGTTPSAGMIELVRKHCNLTLQVLIRPRGGDFCYSAIEFEVMKRDILLAKQLGVDGVVVGILQSNGSVDTDRTKALVQLARPLSVTFHRAFDMVREPLNALEDIMNTGAKRILTSGCRDSAFEGLDLIGRLVKQARGRIVIMAGGGINAGNCKRIVEESGVREIHVGGAVTAPSPMSYRNEAVHIGKAFTPDEYKRFQTDPDKIKALVQSLS